MAFLSMLILANRLVFNFIWSKFFEENNRENPEVSKNQEIFEQALHKLWKTPYGVHSKFRFNFNSFLEFSTQNLGFS